MTIRNTEISQLSCGLPGLGELQRQRSRSPAVLPRCPGRVRGLLQRRCGPNHARCEVPGRGPRQTGAVLSGARRPGLPGREGKPSRPLRPNGGEVALPDAERFQQEHGIRERYTKSRVPAPRLPRLGYIGSGTGILRWAIIFFLKSYMQNSAFCIAAV